jgi:hypothetical protein
MGPKQALHCEITFGWHLGTPSSLALDVHQCLCGGTFTGVRRHPAARAPLKRSSSCVHQGSYLQGVCAGQSHALLSLTYFLRSLILEVPGANDPHSLISLRRLLTHSPRRCRSQRSRSPGSSRC